MKYKALIVVLITLVVSITVIFSFLNTTTETANRDEVNIVLHTMRILNKSGDDDIINLEKYTLNYCFNQLSGLSDQDIKSLKKMIIAKPNLEIHGSKNMGISFVFSVDRIGLYKEKVKGYVYFSKESFTKCEKYDQLNNEIKFEYEDLGNNVYSFTFEQHRSFIYNH
jgi:hypothetical protein